MEKMIEFSPPDITEAEISEVVDTLQSGWITTGPKTKKFEREIAAYCNTKYAVCLNSATACLEMTLRILGIGKGDEVITTAYTYTASASVVCHVGAKLVLVDTRADSLEMDYEQLENAVNENTKAIDLSSESIKSDEAGLEIGSYEYSAEFINDLYNEPNLKYYSFVSSSDSPSVPNGEFVLVDTIDNQNTIRYQIGLKNGSNPIKWYTGDMSVSLGENVSNEVDGLLAGPASYKVLDNKIIIEDSGVILFKLTESADNPFEIPPGTYNSNIYFHVIANL